MVVFLECIWELPEQKFDAKLAEVADEILVTQAENTTYSSEDGVEVRVDRDAFERSNETVSGNESMTNSCGTNLGR